MFFDLIFFWSHHTIKTNSVRYGDSNSDESGRRQYRLVLFFFYGFWEWWEAEKIKVDSCTWRKGMRWEKRFEDDRTREALTSISRPTGGFWSSQTQKQSMFTQFAPWVTIVWPQRRPSSLILYWIYFGKFLGEHSPLVASFIWLGQVGSVKAAVSGSKEMLMF